MEYFFYGNWSNQPPQGFSGSEYGVSSGLSWTYQIIYANLLSGHRYAPAHFVLLDDHLQDGVVG
jgi:hypothetical protein